MDDSVPSEPRAGRDRPREIEPPSETPRRRVLAHVSASPRLCGRFSSSRLTRRAMSSEPREGRDPPPEVEPPAETQRRRDLAHAPASPRLRGRFSTSRFTRRVMSSEPREGRGAPPEVEPPAAKQSCCSCLCVSAPLREILLQPIDAAGDVVRAACGTWCASRSRASRRGAEMQRSCSYLCVSAPPHAILLQADSDSGRCREPERLAGRMPARGAWRGAHARRRVGKPATGSHPKP